MLAFLLGIGGCKGANLSLPFLHSNKACDNDDDNDDNDGHSNKAGCDNDDGNDDKDGGRMVSACCVLRALRGGKSDPSKCL